MSTWCAAKSLFLYYRKYLSEHICNRLLWERIRGNLVHTTHSGGFTFRQRTPKHLKQLLPTTPATHSCRKLVQPEFPAFSRYRHTWLWLFLLPLWFCWKGLWFPTHKFPPATPLRQAGKGVSFCQILSLVNASEDSACLALLHHPVSFGKPLALPHLTWHAGSIWRDPVLQAASRQLKLFQRSQLQYNAQGKQQFLTDTISGLQIQCQQCSSLILVTDKRKWQGNAGPHRKNLKSKTFTAEQNQSLLVRLLFSSQKWRAL